MTQNRNRPRPSSYRGAPAPDNDPYSRDGVGISSYREKPVEGLGHETMAVSSLSHFTNYDDHNENVARSKRPKPRRPVFKNADMLDGDALGGDEPQQMKYRQPPSRNSGNKDMKKVKARADEMIRAREAVLGDEDLDQFRGRMNETYGDDDEYFDEEPQEEYNGDDEEGQTRIDY